MNLRSFLVLALALAAGCITPQTSPTEGGVSRPRNAQGGGLTAREIVDVIKAGVPKIRGCYEQALEESPKIRGQVKTRFVIAGKSGNVETFDITEDTVQDETLAVCLEMIMRGLSFPKPRGGWAVTVNYPFVFNPDPYPATK